LTQIEAMYYISAEYYNNACEHCVAFYKDKGAHPMPNIPDINESQFIHHLSLQNPTWYIDYATQTELQNFVHSITSKRDISVPRPVTTLINQVGRRLFTCARATYSAQVELSLDKPNPNTVGPPLAPPYTKEPPQ
jgi:hypothetical protein